MLVDIPYVHGTAHDPERIVVLERRDGGVLVEGDRVPVDAVGFEEAPEDARMLAVEMLEDEKAHGARLHGHWRE